MVNIESHKSSSQLRIGLIVDSNWSSKYVYDLCEWAKQQKVLAISHIFIQELPKGGHSKPRKALDSFRKNGFLEMLADISFSILTKFELLLLVRSKVHADHLGKFNLNDFGIKSTLLQTTQSKSGMVHRFSDQEIHKISKTEIDVLVRCGTGILRGKILSATRFGIISFHHGDNRVNRGGPSGFWEVFLRQESTGFTLQQLTEELDGGRVLARGNYPTRKYYLLNQASLALKSNHYMKKTLEHLANYRKLPDEEKPIPFFNPLYRRPDLRVQGIYSLRLFVILARDLLKKLHPAKQEPWRVAYIKGNWRSIVMRKGIKLLNPTNHFLADPFVITVNNSTFCFVEDFDFEIKRGSISVYALGEHSAQRIGKAISEPFHMSFPFVFRDESKIYMLPETAENRDIRLYECINFPLEWRLKKILMSNINAADSIIFKNSGLWWLFTNIDVSDLGDHSSELHIFYSENLITDSWNPHRSNPIFIDSSKARNAGFLVDDSNVFRVSQRHGLGAYGKSASLNRVIKLNPDEYLEEFTMELEPNFFPNLRGTHHLHSNGQFTVFDFLEK